MVLPILIWPKVKAPFATIPSVLLDQIRAQYAPEAFGRIAVDCSTCWEPKDTNPPEPLLNPFQLLGSSVIWPRLSHDSMLPFDICWADEKKDKNKKVNLGGKRRQENLRRIAEKKARAFNAHPDEIIITADTIVAIKGENT